MSSIKSIPVWRIPRWWSKKSPTVGPTERTPKPGYLISINGNLLPGSVGIRKVLFNFLMDGGFRYLFLNPEPWGFMIQFDFRIFFKWVVQPPTRFWLPPRTPPSLHRVLDSIPPASLKVYKVGRCPKPIRFFNGVTWKPPIHGQQNKRSRIWNGYCLG